MGKFRFKRGIPLDYDVQGYIYFLSHRYRRLPKQKKRLIDEICEQAGGKDAPALKAFVTTDRGAEEICMRYYISESTLERMVRRYYLLLAEKL